MRNRKKVLSRLEVLELRQVLHIATLEALVASHNWEPGELVFQGGSSLRLAQKSPRSSEDLDFLVLNSLDLTKIHESVRARLEMLTEGIPGDMRVVVSKPKNNPFGQYRFHVTLTGDNVIGSVKVKVELFPAERKTLENIQVFVAPIEFPDAEPSGDRQERPGILAATLPEIYADKIFAVGARKVIKHRDFFDLHWLRTYHGLRDCSPDYLRVRLATYTDETPGTWLEKAIMRHTELCEIDRQIVADELRKWLPLDWSLTDEEVGKIMQSSIEALEHGIDLMRDIEAEMTNEDGPTL
ncbi:MAG: nucleotidyl transferase AbiEii/AbiGii toxin family protein [Zoogloeaceae bacterium]|jgi:predicted nucleotidyltransferase component of viral defense system|nr:nucleotidyl transferase AbiEii/AbiGii toxin family protein [Zoogloeaceae bacterium]